MHRVRRYGRSGWVPLVLFTLLVSALTIAPAQAQTRAGVQGGASLEPDQAYVGSHLVTPPLLENLRLRPSVDVGFGDHLTLVAFNFEFLYTFLSRPLWSAYAGAGPAINYYNFDGGSDTEGGFNILFGAQHRDGLFLEMKVGMMESPDLKFGVGYTFR
jgi:hypothetical protein